MGDSAITIVAIFLAAILMFIFPLMTMADKTDDATALTVKSATTEFTNKIRTRGYISQEDYDTFVLAVAATGNSYDTDITVYKLDANPAKKQQGEEVRIGDNIYYTMYTTQVLEAIGAGSSEDNTRNLLALSEGDIVTVKVQNTNTTIAGQLRNFFYRVTGNSDGAIVAEASGMVTKSYGN